ncbi:hypothetical protein [Cytobacillus kochii]
MEQWMVDKVDIAPAGPVHLHLLEGIFVFHQILMKKKGKKPYK